MYSVRIRRHIMIAHSLPSPAFGPAQRLHGATYVVDAEFFCKELDADNIVIDIALATDKLGEVLQPLEYQNLDELPQFAGQLTTTEFLCRYIQEQLSQAVGSAFTGSLKITLGESHVAWATYQQRVG